MAPDLDKTEAVKEPKQTDILDSLKLDQTISLAKNKAKQVFIIEAQSIYQDIITKFPKNKRAIVRFKSLIGERSDNASKIQDPSKDQLQATINLYNQGRRQQSLEEVQTLFQQFPKSPILFNIQGVILRGMGQIDRSATAFKHAIALRPIMLKLITTWAMLSTTKVSLKRR